MNFIRIILLFIVCVLLGVGASSVYKYGRTKTQTEVIFIPTGTTFTLQPPSKSMKASLLVLNGSVTKYFRNSSESASVFDNAEIVQGDSLETDATSSTSIVFENNIKILASSNSKLQFINTIPQELLLWQQAGEVTYDTTASGELITVRSLSLLTSISSASATLSVNKPKPNVITISTGTAPIKVAYQDLNANTHVVELSASSSAIYNHPKRLLNIVLRK